MYWYWGACNGQYIKYKLLSAIITIIIYHLFPVFDQILIFIAPDVQIRDDNVSNATSTNTQVKISVLKGYKSNKLVWDLIRGRCRNIRKYNSEIIIPSQILELNSLQDLWNKRLVEKPDILRSPTGWGKGRC